MNALVSDNGFIKPSEKNDGNMTIIRPGFAGNAILGAIAAFIAWGFYGTFSSAIVYGSATGVGTDEFYVTISTIASAILTGIGGAHWLTNEVDKILLKNAAAASKGIPGRSPLLPPQKRSSMIPGRSPLRPPQKRPPVMPGRSPPLHLPRISNHQEDIPKVIDPLIPY